MDSPLTTHAFTGPVDPGFRTDSSKAGVQHSRQSVQAVPGVPRVVSGQQTGVARVAATRKRPVIQDPLHKPSSKPLAGDIDLADPHLPVNFVAPDFPVLETLVPGPKFSPILKGDAWLDWAGSKPGDVRPPPYVGEQDSLSWIRAQLQERQRTEADKGEFQLRPLLTTLENMQIFIRHIQDGLQFPEPLTEEEAAALARILAQTAPLVTNKTPYYKRTVCLSLSLMILCDIITDRQILDTARAQEDTGLAYRLVLLSSLPDNRAYRAQLLAALPLLPASPDAPGPPENMPLPLYNRTRLALEETICDQTLLLYPSFHPLTLGHFCRLGPLPLHPVGLTPDYACSADGAMMSPLEFAEHDIGHMKDRCKVGRCPQGPQSPTEALLDCHDKRLQLSQLLLDSLPDSPGWQPLKAPLTLLLFQLFHEETPVFIASIIDYSGSPFLFFLKLLAKARRNEWNSYTEDDRRGTDKEAAQAALWAAFLWELWQDTDSQIEAVTPEVVRKLAGRFDREARPELQAHLRFLEKHRGTLRQLFVDNGRIDGCSPGGNSGFETGAAWPQQHSLTLFQYTVPKTGLCHLDNTDLGYFSALHSPQLRQKIEMATGEDLPPGTAESAPLEPNGAMKS